MSFGTDAIMPLHPGVCLAMIFGAGPAIMSCLLGINLLRRQKLETLYVIGFTGAAGWYCCDVERFALPFV